MKIKSFTLLEILIVIAIIAILAAIGIPRLLYPCIRSNESLALKDLRIISDSAVMYSATHSSYPSNLTQLYINKPAYIDQVLASGSKAGYRFVLTGSTNNYSVSAIPKVYGTTGIRSFFVDQDGVIRWTDKDSAATASDQPIFN